MTKNRPINKDRHRLRVHIIRTGRPREDQVNSGHHKNMDRGSYRDYRRRLQPTKPKTKRRTTSTNNTNLQPHRQTPLAEQTLPPDRGRESLSTKDHLSRQQVPR